MNNLEFGNFPFGRNASIEIEKNEGLFNDIRVAISNYYQIFGITDALQDLKKVYFKNGKYRFVFEKDQKELNQGWEQLVKFVISQDWEQIWELSVTVGDKNYIIEPIFNINEQQNER